MVTSRNYQLLNKQCYVQNLNLLHAYTPFKDVLQICNNASYYADGICMHTDIPRANIGLYVSTQMLHPYTCSEGEYMHIQHLDESLVHSALA